MPADLHIHTTFSDGSLTPEEIVGLARSHRLEAIAITDHDTLDGIRPALRAGVARGIEVIPGIELGSYDQGEEIHILGYLVNLDDPLFHEKLAIFRETRIHRMERMVGKLQNFGFPVNMKMIENIAGAGSLGRPHLATVLVKIGAVQTMGEAFERYIGVGCPAYVPRHKMAPIEAVTLIKSAGGVPILAHPGLNKQEYSWSDLIKAGLAGIEVYHPAHTVEQSNYFGHLAGQKGLIATGGSDYHGPDHKEGNRLGTITVPYSVVEELKKRVK